VVSSACRDAAPSMGSPLTRWREGEQEPEAHPELRL